MVSHPNSPSSQLFEPSIQSPQLGKYLGMVGDWNWPSPIFKRIKKSTRFKNWCFISLQNSEWILSVALADLGYAQLFFTYFYDFKTKQMLEYKTRALPNGLFTLKGNFNNGHATIKTQNLQLDLLSSFTHSTQEFNLNVNFLAAAAKDNERFGASFNLQSSQTNPFMQIMAPLKTDYITTAKNCLLETSQIVLFRKNNKKSILAKTYASIDLSCGYPLHITRWNWLSFSGETNLGEKLGLNLATGFYPEGYAENTVFFRNQIIFVETKIIYEWREPVQQWHIFSEDEKINLHFTPFAKTHENTNLILLASKFEHHLGSIKGTLKFPFEGKEQKVSLNWHCALLEDHFAKW